VLLAARCLEQCCVVTLRAVLRSAGLSLPKLGRSVWVIAPDGAAIDEIYGVLDALLERRPGYLLVLSAPLGPGFASLARCYEREVVLPLPRKSALQRFVRRANPALAIMLGSDGAWRSRWQRDLQALRIPLATLAPGESVAFDALAKLLPTIALTRALRESLRQPSGLARFVTGPLGGLGLALFSRRRIADWDELAQRLGRPQRILCLGNGPSSEVQELESCASDTLFRVNWRWRNRGFLSSPQLVFIGDPTTPNHVSTPILGFRTAEEASYVLWRQCLRLRRFRFFIFDEMKGASDSRGWAARPTNGAIMVATAAALRPQRLVIAGIDLYRHPEGRYPGGGKARDGYNRVHDRNVEIEMIRQALSGFAGEIRILSPILAAALAERDVTASRSATS
jgi:hypothetical protein